MIDFSTLKSMRIPEGIVTEIEDENGYVLWMLKGNEDNGDSIVIEVEKVVSNTYAGSTTYSNEEFILLDIYPKTNGAVEITYGGLTKTITDTSGVAEPNAQTVFFGTFNGVVDEVETPSSGTLTIKGDCSGFGAGNYIMMNKGNAVYYKGFTAINSYGNISFIPNNAFKESKNLVTCNLPSTLKSIGDYAFYHCGKVNISEIPEGVESIGEYSFYMDTDEYRNPVTALSTMTLPSTLKTIGNYAFTYFSESNYKCDMSFIIHATTPPTISEYTFGKYGASGWVDYDKYGAISVLVPKGCLEAYQAAEYWSIFANHIGEEA